jgi:hypothetical protein
MTAGDVTQTPATDTAAKELRCTFCRKSKFDVRKLIAGPTAFICDECVAVSAKLCEDDKTPGETLGEIGIPGAAHITDVLRRCDVLGDGRVRDIVVESSRNTTLSCITRLRLAYDGPAAGAPGSVILKTGLPGRAEGGRREVAFYDQVARVMSVQLTPRCFEAYWEPETQAWRLLLEDLTESHAPAPTRWPLPPAIEQCETVVRASARFHAAWWDDPRLGTTVGQWSTAETLNQYLERFSAALQQFARENGDRLPRERHELYERLLTKAPSLRARYHSRRNLTIVQGDAHVWNFFLPKNGDTDDVRLFDWDSWRIGVGSDDLAYMIAMHWYPDRRRRWEQPLLDIYHAALAEHAVGGYDRRALGEDYRLSVLWQITTPVWQAAYDIPPLIWWNNLERIFLAVDDLGCRELL